MGKNMMICFKKHFLISFFLFLLFFNINSFLLHSMSPSELIQDNERIADDAKKIIQFYTLNENEKWRDITKEILNSSETSETAKNSIKKYRRRIIVFQYPSDGLRIKGFFSYTPNPALHPLLILFRWGNQNFALMNPGLDLATYENYTVISSTLRGGVSEGKDEFGGADVNDMKNLIDFIPALAKELNIQIHPHCTFMLGPSRGGLEMFLTLSRFPELQKKVTKAVALSSILDLHEQIRDRPYDMKPMFEESFGLTKQNWEKWIQKRDPLQTVSKLNPNLPILIVQGAKDPRIDLKEGYRMRDTLEKHGHKVSYIEVPNGNHTLSNVPQAMNFIADWLEYNANCETDIKRS